MDALPDNLVVLVLSWLDAGTVLRVRSVCRRLCELAVHPDVWQERRLSDDDGRPDSLRKAILRVAPCLRFLNFHFRSLYSPKPEDLDLDFEDYDDEEQMREEEEFYELLHNTSCAAEGVGVHLELWNCVQVVSNQLDLGLVKVLHLFLGQDIWSWRDEYSELVVRVLTSPGLTELGVSCCTGNPYLEDLEELVPDELEPPSIRKLVFKNAKPDCWPPAWTDFLLRSHAATLEEVSFWEDSDYYGGDAAREGLSQALVDVLAGAPRLRALNFPGWPRLVAALPPVVPSLTSLGIRGGVGPAVVALLRSAASLERLELEDDDQAGVLAAVEAAASSGRSPLRHIEMRPAHSSAHKQYTREEKGVDLSTLSIALPSLRHLTILEIGWVPPEGFYATLGARTTPHLQSLRVDIWFVQCAHAWLHSDGLLDLLEELPRLRVLAGNAGRCDEREPWNPFASMFAFAQPDAPKNPCPPCQRKCHLSVPSGECSKDSRMAHQRLACAYSSHPMAWKELWFEKTDWLESAGLPALLGYCLRTRLP